MTDTTQTGATEGSAAQTSTDQSSSTTTSASTDAGKGQTDASAGGGAAAKAGGAKGDGGKAAETPFYESFTDAKLKESPVVLRHKTVEDLARSLTAAESKLGVPADQLIRKPTKPEEYPDVYRALGAPEKPEDYKIGLPDKATDADRALADRFGKAMFEKGPFPPDFVKAAVDFINGETLASDAELEAAQTQRKTEGEAFLKKELGAAYDPEMKAVGKLLADLGGEELAKELDASGLGDNPRLLLALHKVVEKLGEPGDLKGGNAGTGGSAPMTPGQAKAARITLENDPVKGPALRDSGHAMHKAVVDERRRLFQLEAGRDPDKQAA